MDIMVYNGTIKKGYILYSNSPLWDSKIGSIPLCGKNPVKIYLSYGLAKHFGKNKHFQGERSIPKIWYKPILSDYINILNGQKARKDGTL